MVTLENGSLAMDENGGKTISITKSCMSDKYAEKNRPFPDLLLAVSKRRLVHKGSSLS